MVCGGAYSSDRSTRVTHMANGALMTRTLHMAPTSTSVRGLHAGHGRRHAVMNPYPHAHLRGTATEACTSTSGGARRVPTGQQLVSRCLPSSLSTEAQRMYGSLLRHLWLLAFE